MDPKKTQELFDIFIHDYFKKRGLLRCAELFANEAHITGLIPPEFDQHPRGYLFDVWNIRQRTLGSYSQSQATNFAAVMNSIPQIIRNGYPIQLIVSFQSGQTLSSCDFSSDGKIVASGGNSGKPFICYMDTFSSVTTSESHSSTILDVRFQPGSTIFATSSADKTVKLWDAKKPEKVLCNVVGHTGIVRSLDFHPLGGILCSSDTCDVIKVWDLNQRVMMKNFMAGSLVRFQPGFGKLLAVANQNVITILEYPSLVFKNSLQGHVKHICSLCWDVTGQTIASVSEDCVRVWSLSIDGQCFYKYPSNGKRFQSVIFHPRYRNVLVVSGFQCMELLTLGYGQIHHIRASSSSFTGLAACTGDESIASTTTSNDSESIVNISVVIGFEFVVWKITEIVTRFGHRGTISEAVSVVFRGANRVAILGNRDTIQKLNGEVV